MIKLSNYGWYIHIVDNYGLRTVSIDVTEK